MGCGGSTDAAAGGGAAADGNKERKLHVRPNWSEIQAKLPVARTDAEKAKRLELFKKFDVNNNGYLSLAEVDKGVRDVLQIDALFASKDALMRAFQAAKGLNPNPGQGADYVEKNEFRMLLVYLSEYFKIWCVFAQADESDDRRLTREEFARTLPALNRWAPGKTVDQCWTEILPPNQTKILFTEFAEWAIQKQLATLVEDPRDE